MRADGWSRMPLVRMTNLHLEPGEGSLDDLLADVDDGIYLETNKSLVDRRQAPQLPVRDAGRMGDQAAASSDGCCGDATYTGVTPVFWGSLDAVGGPDDLGALRPDELRQGPARPARARLARSRAGAIPQRPGRRGAVVTSALDLAERAARARRRATAPKRSSRPSTRASRDSPDRRCTSRR